MIYYTFSKQEDPFPGRLQRTYEALRARGCTVAELHALLLRYGRLPHEGRPPVLDFLLNPPGEPDTPERKSQHQVRCVCL
jgi:hypothetical protein